MLNRKNSAVRFLQLSLTLTHKFVKKREFIRLLADTIMAQFYS